MPRRLECEPGPTRQTGVRQQRLQYRLHALPVQKVVHYPLIGGRGGGQEEAEGEGRERGKNALAKRRIKRRALQPKWTRWHWEKTETGLRGQTAQLHDVQT